jgi:cell division protein FtsQ
MTATVAVLIGAIALGVIKGGHGEDVVASLSDARNAAANAVGFRITSVAISGRKQLTQDEVLAIGGINGRSSLLFLDAATVRDKLEADPWIREATVQKLYPGRLQIDIVERTPLALWQKGGHVTVIADDGTVLQDFNGGRFMKLPLVVGEGAAKEARGFLALLGRYPTIRESTAAAVLVAQRRWNVRLDSGIDVKLPEGDVAQALQTLVTLDRDKHLLTRDITAIDLRLPDRVSVRLSDDAARARADAMKDLLKKQKKKGREA